MAKKPAKASKASKTSATKASKRSAKKLVVNKLRAAAPAKAKTKSAAKKPLGRFKPGKEL